MTPNTGCVKPTMKKSLTLFLSLLKMNTNGDMNGRKTPNGTKKWYEHKPLPWSKYESFKVLFNFSIQMDEIIEHRRPDMIIIDKTSKKSQIVDFTVPTDRRIEFSQQKKIENYQDLKHELQKL